MPEMTAVQRELWQVQARPWRLLGPAPSARRAAQAAPGANSLSRVTPQFCALQTYPLCLSSTKGDKKLFFPILHIQGEHTGKPWCSDTISTTWVCRGTAYDRVGYTDGDTRNGKHFVQHFE